MDTNLLILFFIGIHDPDRIQKFKRTVKFTREDFDRIVSLLNRFKVYVTTPSILTEVSNFLGELPEKLRSVFYQRFARGIEPLREQYTTSRELSNKDYFPRLGLTDSGILHTARGRYLVLTDDFRLAQYLQHLGIDVINSNHLRVLNGFGPLSRHRSKKS